MRLKSYFAGTVEGALNLARQELGPDAMLLDSRRTGAESRHLGECEVICAVLPPKLPASVISADENTFPELPGLRAPGIDRLSQEVSELKRYMERMAVTINRSNRGAANLRARPELAEISARLSTSDLDPALAQEIVAIIAERTEDDTELEASLAAEIEKLIAVDPRLGVAGAKRNVAAMVGPPGSGKTTCLVKLAASFGLAKRKPTQILSLDTYRIAAADQLRSYAAILGVGFQVVETPAALAQALDECRNKELILIDTPGFAKDEMDEAQEIARFLSTHPEIDPHLVLSACTKSRDLQRIAASYSVFRPAKLIFSRIDETATFGPLASLSAQIKLPVSFLSIGQRIPEDFEPAKKRRLADLVLGHAGRRAEASVAAA